MGLATAAGSLGQFMFAPLGQAFLTDYGWQAALLLLAGSMVIVPALAVALKGGGRQQDTRDPALPARDAVRQAFGHGSYLLLVAGFFVCGFHVAFITTHLPAHIAVAAGHTHGGMDTAGPSGGVGAYLSSAVHIVGSYGRDSGALPASGVCSRIYSRGPSSARLHHLPHPAVVLVFAAAMESRAFDSAAAWDSSP